MKKFELVITGGCLTAVRPAQVAERLLDSAFRSMLAR
jgi:hypothetical protein